eukprot:2908-Heterococcus_DN1.PRE.3
MMSAADKYCLRVLQVLHSRTLGTRSGATKHAAQKKFLPAAPRSQYSQHYNCYCSCCTILIEHERYVVHQHWLQRGNKSEPNGGLANESQALYITLSISSNMIFFESEDGAGHNHARSFSNRLDPERTGEPAVGEKECARERAQEPAATSPRVTNIHMEMAGGMDSMTRLILTQPMTVFAFPDTLFSVHVALVDAMDAGNTGRAGQPLEVQLMHGDGKTVFSAANNLLSIESPPVLSNRGLCELKCKIAEDYRGTGNLGGGLRCFQLRISVAGRPDVEPLLTDGVTIIRYCLQVRENPAKPVPKEWFKDEGGRENCVEMQVHLIDREGVE